MLQLVHMLMEIIMNNKKHLKAQNGLIIGIDDKKNYYYADGYQHILLMAPTGAGKGVSFVIPNLLSWQESAIIHDIKSENYFITSGWRASQGQKIYMFDPLNTEGKTHCYNPLDFISSNPDQMVDDIGKIAHILIPDHDFCHSQERSLFIALTLLVMANPKKTKSFGEIFRILAGDLTEELSVAVNKLNLHKVGKILINSFLHQAPQECSSIASSLASHLELWGNQLIDQATSKSDFNPANFKVEKSTLYVGVHPSDIDRLKPLMQFFYQHVAQVLTKKSQESEKETHGVLMLLDDFPTLGRMDFFTTCIPYFRGYKVRLAIMAQDLNHIQTSYCDKGTNTILSNSSFKIAFTTNHYETANLISNLSADKISWQKIMSLPSDKQVILVDNEEVLISQKLHYFNIPEFKNKVMTPVNLKFK